jgi:wyosine [tRNA(Phe)-imidazoG37] synthetase (radical SAM superfamily)
MKYISGPVPSRRLGQLGRSLPLTNQRSEYVPVKELLLEAEQVLGSYRNGDIDWVTFVGSGEPTLHSCLGELIRRVKNITAFPVAVITNGSLLYLPEVRQELIAVDAILPTLDAGIAELYRKINRPHPQITFERLVDGLITFRKEYRGKLWVEVILGNIAEVVHPAEGSFDLSGYENVVDAIIDIITRHPMRQGTHFWSAASAHYPDKIQNKQRNLT